MVEEEDDEEEEMYAHVPLGRNSAFSIGKVMRYIPSNQANNSDQVMRIFFFFNFSIVRLRLKIWRRKNCLRYYY